MPGTLSVYPQGMEHKSNRPVEGEVCPRCNGSRIAASDEIPPMRCLDCGDRWAGLYRPCSGDAVRGTGVVVRVEQPTTAGFAPSPFV